MKKLVRSLIVFYSRKFAPTICYMLQANEYSSKKYLAWFWTTEDFSKVIVRKDLVKTKKAKSIIHLINIGVIFEILLGILVIILGLMHKIVGGIYFGAAIIVIYPLVWSQAIALIISLARFLVVKPQEKRIVESSKEIFKNTKAKKIAIAGSYGKTSMKELLSEVLSSKYKVASTPGNMNVSTSHAKFAAKLTGKEDFLIIEFGEGEPGDVVRFCKTTDPDLGVITGLSAAHLDKYKTIENAGKDIFSLSKYVGPKNVYVNKESKEAVSFITDEITYDHDGVGGYKVSKVKNTINGISFVLSKGSTNINIRTALLGRHQIGVLSAVAAISLDLGMSASEIEKAISGTKAYEHRMQPYEINGAKIIDDTYNGNLEGIRAGTSLLAELDARRKIYVTPGLVDQGKLKESVHIQMGELIAKANPDIVVLMDNSVTRYIEEGLKSAGFGGEVQIQDDPLMFYSNLSSYVASGDVVLMQNDWTDNYS